MTEGTEKRMVTSLSLIINSRKRHLIENDDGSRQTKNEREREVTILLLSRQNTSED